jgi:hypothetical protein
MAGDRFSWDGVWLGNKGGTRQPGMGAESKGASVTLPGEEAAGGPESHDLVDEAGPSPAEAG